MKSSLFLVTTSLACIGAFAATSTATDPNVHDLMKKVVAVQAQVIWDVGNNAQDDAGNPDASKLKAADWSKAANAAAQIRQAAQALAHANHVLAAAPGQKLDGEGSTPGAYGAKQVQAVIDKNPRLFQAFAEALTVSMSEIESAAKTKNAVKLFDASGRLDQVCEDCHMKFWYPEEKALQ